MIFKETSNEIVSSMESHNFGVQIDDVSFIINAITNMYSDPIGSIVRELASNCRDADRDKTFIVGMEGREVYFRDFGIGMSREFMLSDYLSVGKSTKRKDSSAIGSFGFGRISVLSYVDSYFVTTCHGGTKTKYLVTKDGLTPSISVLEMEETTEVGTMVSFLHHMGDGAKWQTAIRGHTSYFQNCELHIFSPVRVEHHSYEHGGAILKYSPNISTLHLVVGECLYPLDMDQLDIHGTDGFNGAPLGLYIPIEEGFRPVPSRESMVYTEDFKKYVLDKLTVLNSHFDELILLEERQFKIMEYLSTGAFEFNMGEKAMRYKIPGNIRQLLHEKKKIDWTGSLGHYSFYNVISQHPIRPNKFVLCPPIIPRGFAFVKKDTNYVLVRRSGPEPVQLFSIVDGNRVTLTQEEFATEMKRRQTILNEYYEELEREPNYTSWKNYVASLNIVKKVVARTKKEGIKYLRSSKTQSSRCVVDIHEFSELGLIKAFHYVAVGPQDQVKFDILYCFSELCKKRSIWLLPDKTQLTRLREVLTHKIFDMNDLTTIKNPILTRVYHQIKIKEAVGQTGIRNCAKHNVRSIIEKVDPNFVNLLMGSEFSITPEAREAILEAAESLGIPDPDVLNELKARKNIYDMLTFVRTGTYGKLDITDTFLEEFQFYFNSRLAHNKKQMRLERIVNAHEPFNDPVETLELIFEFDD